MRWVRRLAVAVVVLVAALLAFMRAQGIPLHATRHTPPPGIAGRALAVGVPAPDVTLTTHAGTPWRVRDHLAPGGVVLVFYRGHW